jgi:uncharacterized membrane protein YciS (DUF1049 family)
MRSRPLTDALLQLGIAALYFAMAKAGLALASLVQAGFLIGLALAGMRLARRVDELNARLDRELKPALENLTRVSRAAAEIADLATLQQISEASRAAGRPALSPAPFPPARGGSSGVAACPADHAGSCRAGRLCL